jgi:hypothetical protein
LQHRHQAAPARIVDGHRQDDQVGMQRLDQREGVVDALNDVPIVPAQFSQLFAELHAIGHRIHEHRARGDSGYAGSMFERHVGFSSVLG